MSLVSTSMGAMTLNWEKGEQPKIEGWEKGEQEKKLGDGRKGKRVGRWEKGSIMYTIFSLCTFFTKKVS